MPLGFLTGHIEGMYVDAIVNDANITLLGGGGIDGVIHRAAGPELTEECKRLNGCETGKVKVSNGHRLPCRYVIHAVGPIWHGGIYGEKDLLISCYEEALSAAHELNCESIAFPLISTSIFGYPKDKALEVATGVFEEYLEHNDLEIYLVLENHDSFLIDPAITKALGVFIDQRLSRSIQEHSVLPDEKASDPFPYTSHSPSGNGYYSAGGFTDINGWDDVPEPFSYSSSHIINDYLIAHQGEGFRDALLQKIDEKQMTDVECYKKANIDRKLFNKIKNVQDYRPRKSTVLALAIALKLSLTETEELLKTAGFSLTNSSKSDLIVEYFIREKHYNIQEINEALYYFHADLLGSTP